MGGKYGQRGYRCITHIILLHTDTHAVLPCIYVDRTEYELVPRRLLRFSSPHLIGWSHCEGIECQWPPHDQVVSAHQWTGWRGRAQWNTWTCLLVLSGTPHLVSQQALQLYVEPLPRNGKLVLFVYSRSPEPRK